MGARGQGEGKNPPRLVQNGPCSSSTETHDGTGWDGTDSSAAVRRRGAAAGQRGECRGGQARLLRGGLDAGCGGGPGAAVRGRGWGGGGGRQVCWGAGGRLPRGQRGATGRHGTAALPPAER